MSSARLKKILTAVTSRIEGIPYVWISIGDKVCVICAFDVIQGICL